MEKNWKNKVIQSEEFNVKESWRYNVSVLINLHWDLEKMISSVVKSPMYVLLILTQLFLLLLASYDNLFGLSFLP